MYGCLECPSQGEKKRVIMKRRKIVTFLIVVCFLFLAWPLPAHAAAHSVCLDAGHGGTDAGAVYQSLQEKQGTLDIATRLQTLLQNAGYNVVMTRTSDITLSNLQRASICNNAIPMCCSLFT